MVSGSIKSMRNIRLCLSHSVSLGQKASRSLLNTGFGAHNEQHRHLPERGVPAKGQGCHALWLCCYYLLFIYFEI